MAYHTQIPPSATLRRRIARRQAEIAELRALLEVARTRELAAAAHGVRARRPVAASPTNDADEGPAAEHGATVQP